MAEYKYLYGASIQGIQGFIFQTNELKDIIGASELVEQACTSVFENEFKADGQLLLSAAGNVKCLYTDEAQCRNAVLRYPKRVMEKAPGVTISEAVVKVRGSLSESLAALEKRLRAQRNRPAKSIVTGCMAMERSRKTGLPAIFVDGAPPELVDAGSYSKRHTDGNYQLFKKIYNKIYDETKEGYADLVLDTKALTGQNDWIAVVHADGNALGEVVAEIATEGESSLRDFSVKLDVATQTAARRACADVYTKGALPIRPVVLGGDDLTVICRADVAIPFVQQYLKYFEEESRKRIKHQLSACAGVAFVKSSYPFYYAYNLAEALCGEAKRDAKSGRGESIPSCLMFHKIQSSFVVNYDLIRTQELTPCSGHSFCYGPYYLQPQSDRMSIGDLRALVDELASQDNNKVKNAIREWMSLLVEGVGKAHQKCERVAHFAQYSAADRELFRKATASQDRQGIQCYPAYDILSLFTINNQVTK